MSRTWSGRLLGLAVLVGVLGAAGSVVFRSAIEWSTLLFHGQTARFGSVGVPLALLAGGLVLLGLERLFPGEVLGYGFPRFLEVFHLHGAHVKRRWITLRTLGAAVSLGAGAAVGREGPIAQIGGAIGGTVAGASRLAIAERKLLVACGVAAGIAATFNAPIGAILFVHEIVLLGETELSHMSLVVVAAATAVAATRGLFGVEAVLSPTHFALGSYWACVTYAGLGVLLGGLAVAYIRLFHGVRQLFDRLPSPRWVILLASMGVLGIMGMIVPQNLGDGYPVINEALAGRLVWQATAVLAIAKIAGSSLALGCGVPGGIFGPIFFIGAMVGSSFRALCEAILPALTGPRGSYALIGLGGFLAATTHAPLTAVFLLIEMTEGYGVTVPALLTVGMAMMVAQQLEPESIDLYGLHAEGKTLHTTPLGEALARIPIGNAYLQDVETIVEDAPLAEILRRVGTSRVINLPVVDRKGCLAGVLSFEALRSVLGQDTLDGLIVAADLCDHDVPTVTPAASIAEAFACFERSGLDEIPVIDAAAPRRVIGMLSRANLLAEYNRLITQGVSLGTWIAGTHSTTSEAYRTVTIAVPAEWVGRSLREIDCRRRLGLAVLAVRSGAATADGLYELPDPNRRLTRGDQLVIAGTDASIRQLGAGGGG